MGFTAECPASAEALRSRGGSQKAEDHTRISKTRNQSDPHTNTVTETRTPSSNQLHQVGYCSSSTCSPSSSLHASQELQQVTQCSASRNLQHGTALLSAGPAHSPPPTSRSQTGQGSLLFRIQSCTLIRKTRVCTASLGEITQNSSLLPNAKLFTFLRAPLYTEHKFLSPNIPNSNRNVKALKTEMCWQTRDANAFLSQRATLCAEQKSESQNNTQHQPKHTHFPTSCLASLNIAAQ